MMYINLSCVPGPNVLTATMHPTDKLCYQLPAPIYQYNAALKGQHERQPFIRMPFDDAGYRLHASDPSLEADGETNLLCSIGSVADQTLAELQFS